MAAQITPSLRSAIERLKNGGAINGIMLGWRRQLLLNLLPYEDFRAERLLENLHDAQDHFASGGDRHVHTFWFGYETCHALVLFRGDCVITLLHTRAEEADFLRRAAQTFLEDSQLLINDLLNPVPVEEDEPSDPHHTNLTGNML